MIWHVSSTVKLAVEAAEVTQKTFSETGVSEDAIAATMSLQLMERTIFSKR